MMHNGIVWIAVLIGIACGIGWYVMAQEAQSIQKSLLVNPKPWPYSECPPYECP